MNYLFAHDILPHINVSKSNLANKDKIKIAFRSCGLPINLPRTKRTQLIIKLNMFKR